MSQRIIPALLPSSLPELQADVRSLVFAHELQIDLVDGHYVPFSAWPYEPVGDLTMVESLLASHSIEVDLMVRDQVTAAQQWAQIGAEMVIFHVAGISFAEVKDFAERYTNVSIAIALTTTDPIAVIKQYLPVIDQIQLMGIATIGAQGAPFDERVLDRIKEVRAVNSELSISIDGSMNEQTIPLARAAGADRFVVGSALLRAADRAATFSALTESAARADLS